MEEEFQRLGSAKKVEAGRVMGVFQGEDAFKLYDTYGLPLDFMLDASRDMGIRFDQTGFEKEMRM